MKEKKPICIGNIFHPLDTNKMILEKTVVGTAFGVAGFQDFKKEVAAAINYFNSNGYRILSKKDHSEKCGCTEQCEVIRYRTEIKYSKRINASDLIEFPPNSVTDIRSMHDQHDYE